MSKIIYIIKLIRKRSANLRSSASSYLNYNFYYYLCLFVEINIHNSKIEINSIINENLVNSKYNISYDYLLNNNLLNTTLKQLNTKFINFFELTNKQRTRVLNVCNLYLTNLTNLENILYYELSLNFEHNVSFIKVEKQFSENNYYNKRLNNDFLLKLYKKDLNISELNSIINFIINNNLINLDNNKIQDINNLLNKINLKVISNNKKLNKQYFKLLLDLLIKTFSKYTICKNIKNSINQNISNININQIKIILREFLEAQIYKKYIFNKNSNECLILEMTLLKLKHFICEIKYSIYNFNSYNINDYNSLIESLSYIHNKTNFNLPTYNLLFFYRSIFIFSKIINCNNEYSNKLCLNYFLNKLSIDLNDNYESSNLTNYLIKSIITIQENLKIKIINRSSNFIRIFVSNPLVASFSKNLKLFELKKNFDKYLNEINDNKIINFKPKDELVEYLQSLNINKNICVTETIFSEDGFKKEFELGGRFAVFFNEFDYNNFYNVYIENNYNINKPNTLKNIIGNAKYLKSNFFKEYKTCNINSTQMNEINYDFIIFCFPNSKKFIEDIKLNKYFKIKCFLFFEVDPIFPDLFKYNRDKNFNFILLEFIKEFIFYITNFDIDLYLNNKRNVNSEIKDKNNNLNLLNSNCKNNFDFNKKASKANFYISRFNNYNMNFNLHNNSCIKFSPKINFSRRKNTNLKFNSCKNINSTNKTSLFKNNLNSEIILKSKILEFFNKARTNLILTIYKFLDEIPININNKKIIENYKNKILLLCNPIIEFNNEENISNIENYHIGLIKDVKKSTVYYIYLEKTKEENLYANEYLNNKAVYFLKKDIVQFIELYLNISYKDNNILPNINIINIYGCVEIGKNIFLYKTLEYFIKRTYNNNLEKFIILYFNLKKILNYSFYKNNYKANIIEILKDICKCKIFYSYFKFDYIVVININKFTKHTNNMIKLIIQDIEEFSINLFNLYPKFIFISESKYEQDNTNFGKNIDYYNLKSWKINDNTKNAQRYMLINTTNIMLNYKKFEKKTIDNAILNNITLYLNKYFNTKVLTPLVLNDIINNNLFNYIKECFNVEFVYNKLNNSKYKNFSIDDANIRYNKNFLINNSTLDNSKYNKYIIDLKNNNIVNNHITMSLKEPWFSLNSNLNNVRIFKSNKSIINNFALNETNSNNKNMSELNNSIILNNKDIKNLNDINKINKFRIVNNNN